MGQNVHLVPFGSIHSVTRSKPKFQVSEIAFCGEIGNIFEGESLMRQIVTSYTQIVTVRHNDFWERIDFKIEI